LQQRSISYTQLFTKELVHQFKEIYRKYILDWKFASRNSKQDKNITFFFPYKESFFQSTLGTKIPTYNLELRQCKKIRKPSEKVKANLKKQEQESSS